jgi:AbrB family looped-hinge helix DNA binding protein
MTATVTIDKAGRVVIPKETRDELRLEAGDTLALESEGERVILRPVHGGTPLQKERGVWVSVVASRFRSMKPTNSCVKRAKGAGHLYLEHEGLRAAWSGNGRPCESSRRVMSDSACARNDKMKMTKEREERCACEGGPHSQKPACLSAGS